jgi:hypothetical protein
MRRGRTGAEQEQEQREEGGEQEQQDCLLVEQL